MFAKAIDGDEQIRNEESDEEMKRVTSSEVCRMLMKVIADITELYSPPRVVEEGKKWGLAPGESMDLLTGWDFNLDSHKEAAKQHIRRVKPKLVIGSPMCKMFSSLQNMNSNRWTPAWEEEYKKAEEHVRFMMEIYEIQRSQGGWFLHEHPATARNGT